MNPRSEPLLWTQLLGLAVLPLEALLILLVLAGSDPGPAPLVEELLCWSLGALAPALLLWRAPADVWSLLLVQIPARGRRDLQQRLSRLQTTLPLRVLGPALGSIALLPLLIRLDHHAAIAAPLWPSAHLPRLLALLLAALLLTLMLWQWQQVVQSLWLLSRSENVLRSTPPLSADDLKESRLSLGIPLLLPPSLSFEARSPRPAQSASFPDGPDSGAMTVPEANEASAVSGPTLPVEPEQTAADHQGGNLDEPIA
ncbi:MAG: hypothetical protein RLZZ609_2526 [Cyanobacteriota bacterium]